MPGITRRIHFTQMSNEKMAPSCLYKAYRQGMKSYPVVWGFCFINHEIRILSLSNQDSMESKAVFFHGSHEKPGKMRLNVGKYMPSPTDPSWNIFLPSKPSEKKTT